MRLFRSFDRWSKRHPVLSWVFAVAVAWDIAFAVASCTRPPSIDVANCQSVDAGNPVRSAECGAAR
jgi:hypothetical protein